MPACSKANFPIILEDSNNRDTYIDLIDVSAQTQEICAALTRNNYPIFAYFTSYSNLNWAIKLNDNDYTVSSINFSNNSMSITAIIKSDSEVR